jgi:hypothetical protein
MDCVLCNGEMTAIDYRKDSTAASCQKCLGKLDRREAKIRALVAQAHAEGRMPPALRYIRASAVDVALACYGR